MARAATAGGQQQQQQMNDTHSAEPKRHACMRKDRIVGGAVNLLLLAYVEMNGKL